MSTVPSSQPSETPSVSWPTSQPSSQSSGQPSIKPSLSIQPTCSQSTVGIYSQSGLNGPPGSCSNENDNLLSIVRHFIKIDGEFSKFTANDSIQGFNDPDLASKLNALSFFFMTDMEAGFPLGWDSVSQGIMKNYVALGGTLVMTGTGGSRDADFLNAIFPGWDVASVSCSTTVINPTISLGTPWESNGPLGVSH
jgi:hypothetical protein